MGEENTYRIGDAARMLNLKTHVLRFWETEFSELQPIRTDKGQRLYTEDHIKLLRTIRHLLHERGLTIDGARKELAQHSRRGDSLAQEIVKDLREMRNILTGETN